MDKREINETDSAEEKRSLNFLEQIIEEDLEKGTFGGKVHTRFPPEPNGYLHIGHAKSIVLNFGLKEKYNGKCNLRFDDTNPVKEEQHYIDSIIADIKWLGFEWDELCYASDYFDQLHDWAVKLIKAGKAYVDDLSAESIRQYRGSLTDAGKPSPFRNRMVEENLELFERMKNGEFENGEKVLRAKIDMAHPNLNMRDPVMYRILHAAHHRTGDKWCIYPMYDWAHGQSDSIEQITHSICTLEFEDHRPLYNWFLENLGIYQPKQREFARLNLNYTMMSKRTLLELVQNKHVDGWDDPRMPTISGFRRRGYTAASIKYFCDKVGVAKRDNIIDMALLEHSIREDLNKTAPRMLAVLNPLKVVIENYPDGQTEQLEAVNNPEDPSAGTRQLPFSKVIYIEHDDFSENPPPKFFRLSVGTEVRLRYAYFITCREVVKNKSGEVLELKCTYDPATKGGSSPNGRKVKGTIHWVSAEHAVNAEVRLYDRLFSDPEPSGKKDETPYTDFINKDSLKIISNAKLEPALAGTKPGERFQFERLGYFCVDSKYSSPEKLVINRTVTLRDSWSKIAAKS